MEEKQIFDIREEARLIDQATVGEVKRLADMGRPVCLVDLIATEDEAVHSYVRTKATKAKKLGVEYHSQIVSKDQSTENILELIEGWNRDAKVTGIMVSTPTHAHVNADRLIGAIDPKKDVDGLCPQNVAYLATNEEALAILPATALAAIHIIEKLTALRGKRVIVMGRGRTVGRPVAQMALNRDATVTICHSRTAQPENLAREADIIITAIGRAGAITLNFVRPSHIVIDCGIAIVDGKVRGDVAEEVSPAVAYLSPVPGGVGVLTNSMLFTNLLKAVALQQAQ